MLEDIRDHDNVKIAMEADNEETHPSQMISASLILKELVTPLDKIIIRLQLNKSWMTNVCM